MGENNTAYENVTGFEKLAFFWKFFRRALGLMVDPANRSYRRSKNLTPIDSLFNFVKMSFLQETVLRYRHMVKFRGSVIMDSTFPPFPSEAFDRRLSNYINNLDLTELPSGIVSISTTNRCPYSCAFCSTNAKRNTLDDLDEDLLKSIITQVEAQGTPSIILHGGEPFFRYDRFLRLVKHVHPKTCLWMFTTGFGATPERAAELKENGLFGVWISLDHYLPEVHNKLRGHPEAFQNVVSAVDAFKKAGVYTCLSLVPPDDLLIPENFKKYYEFAKQLGVAEIRVMEVKPSGREACRGVIAHSPVLEQLQKDLYADPKYRDYPPLSGLSTWLEKDPALGCQCRFEYLFITSVGEVQPCEASEISFGNITQEAFQDIYTRACAAFPKPSTGCIPMVMYPEVREFQKRKNDLSSREKSDIATKIMNDFQNRGTIPGAYALIWSIYEKRLTAYKKRRLNTRTELADCER